MKSNHLALLLTITCFCIADRVACSRSSARRNRDSSAHVDDAVSIALANNRLVKNSALEAQKFDFRVSTIRSKRLPQFQFTALGGELMHSFDFTFDKGVFGTYPGVGPIPGNQQPTSIRRHRFTTYLNWQPGSTPVPSSTKSALAFTLQSLDATSLKKMCVPNAKDRRPRCGARTSNL